MRHKCPQMPSTSQKTIPFSPIYQKIPFSNSIALLCHLPPNSRRGADEVPNQQGGACWSPIRLLLSVWYSKTTRARLPVQFHLGHQNSCPKSGIVYSVCSTLIHTQSRGIVFIAYLCRYGC